MRCALGGGGTWISGQQPLSQDTPFDLKRADALILADDSDLCRFFFDAVDAAAAAKSQTSAQTISNWLLSDTMSLLKVYSSPCCCCCYRYYYWRWELTSLSFSLIQSEKLSVGESKLTPAGLAELVGLIEDGTISGKIAKELLPEVGLFFPPCSKI